MSLPNSEPQQASTTTFSRPKRAAAPAAGTMADSDGEEAHDDGDWVDNDAKKPRKDREAVITRAMRGEQRERDRQAKLAAADARRHTDLVMELELMKRHFLAETALANLVIKGVPWPWGRGSTMADLFRIRTDFGNRSFTMVSVAREIYNVDFASGTLRKGITYGYGLEDKKALQERVLRAFGQTDLTVEFLEAAHATHDAIHSVRQQISSFFHDVRRLLLSDLVQVAWLPLVEAGVLPADVRQFANWHGKLAPRHTNTFDPVLTQRRFV